MQTADCELLIGFVIMKNAAICTSTDNNIINVISLWSSTPSHYSLASLSLSSPSEVFFLGCFALMDFLHIIPQALARPGSLCVVTVFP